MLSASKCVGPVLTGGVLFGQVSVDELKNVFDCPYGGDRRWNMSIMDPEIRKQVISKLLKKEVFEERNRLSSAHVVKDHEKIHMQLIDHHIVPDWFTISTMVVQVYDVIYIWDVQHQRWELLSLRFSAPISAESLSENDEEDENEDLAVRLKHVLIRRSKRFLKFCRRNHIVKSITPESMKEYLRKDPIFGRKHEDYPEYEGIEKEVFASPLH
jgi:hypothetical protein